MIPKTSNLDFTNNIDVKTIYLNDRRLKKAERQTFGMIILHDGGDIPYCNRVRPNDTDNCVVKNVIAGMWKKSGLSSHYYIGCSGKIFKLVSEEYVAYHAGCKSRSCLLFGANNISIGIDLRNCSIYNTNNIPYTNEQHVALNNLIQDIKNRHLIMDVTDELVIGHLELLTYKNDPVRGFKWLNITGLKVDHRALIDNHQKTPFQIAVNKTIKQDDGSTSNTA